MMRDELLDAWDRVLVAWADSDAFGRAVAETVARHSYAAEEVQAQLRHVVLRSRGRTMRLVLDDELGAGADLSVAPSTVLVLASGGVPGLVIEGIAAAVAIGATALVRPSRDECVLPHLLTFVGEREPQLARFVELVGQGDDDGDGASDIPWARSQAAIVFGSDETIALVRDRLEPAAAARVAAYGSRQGIAVLAPGADVDPSWATRLADDVLTFRQRGCMSPSWLFVIGSDEEAARLQESIGRELASAGQRHVAPGLDVAAIQRRTSDADVLSAIAAGMDPSSTALFAGDARLTVVRVPDIDQLAGHVAQLGSLLQTAVLATSREDRTVIAQMLLERTGITRICLPGQAHEPDPHWPQDGIGRIAPLLGR